MSRRDDAITLIESVLKPRGVPIEIRSKYETRAFKDYTGIEHDDLVENWRSNNNTGQKSACNGFVSWYAGRMGIGTRKDEAIGSWFALEKSLRSINKAHAWVPADSKARPQRGDILHHRRAGSGLHVDVAMGYTPAGQLIRAAAGQITFLKPRNPDKETDVLKIVTGTSAYDFHNLIGWLDLERFFEATPPAGTAPTVNWTQGWWDVQDGLQYYYYFDVNGTVSYTKSRPLVMFAPPPKPLNTGRYSFIHPHVVFIRWNRLDGEPTEETFTADDPRQLMKGTSNLYGDLAAKRL